MKKIYYGLFALLILEDVAWMTIKSSEEESDVALVVEEQKRPTVGPDASSTFTSDANISNVDFIEFLASKTGTFESFCSVWCGERHMEMRGSIII